MPRIARLPQVFMDCNKLSDTSAAVELWREPAVKLIAYERAVDIFQL
jgi:hypothetical protein